MQTIKILSSNKAQLCCGGKRCPVVELNNNRVQITDDDGNKVTLNIEQARAIPLALTQLK